MEWRTRQVTLRMFGIIPERKISMKKKTRKILLPVILFLILMAMMPVQAQAANRTATTVRMKTYYKSGKKFMTVRGLDRT